MDLVQITKHDETYDKIICDPGIAVEISNYFTFDVPGASFIPAVRNKVWDGKIRLFNTFTCLFYCGLRDQLEQFCKERNYQVEYTFDTAHAEFSAKEAVEFVKSLEMTLVPRDYQMKAFVDSVRVGRALLLSPTASGKSLIIFLLQQYFASKRILLIVPTVSLVHQMVSDFEIYKRYSADECHKIFAGQEKESDSRIVVTTWQSVYKEHPNWFNQFDVVIGDEAHLFKAKSMISIMQKLANCKYRFGFTGTLDNTQCHELILRGLFGPVKKVTTTIELIAKKHLADFNIKALVLSYTDEIKASLAKASYQDEIDFLVRNEKRNKFIKNLALSLDGNTLLLFQYVEKHGTI